MDLPCDWQTDKYKLSERGQYLLETGQWSDCSFIVGNEPHQQTIKAHKLFLAMSSPVFEVMFFGKMAEKDEPIPVRDIQPEAFKALMEYVYTDHIHLGSFELACELYYCAKKYMLPPLMGLCKKYLWSDLSPEKACRAYEFAKLFEESVLMRTCLQIICSRTNEVIKESSWEEIELGTLLTVLDQSKLQIHSELELFHAVGRWARAECIRKSLDPSDGKCLKSVIGNALSKIRFLTLSPQKFAEGPGMSPLLTRDETFAILMNKLCSSNKISMPEGFSTIAHCRDRLLNVGHTTNRDLFPIAKEIYSEPRFARTLVPSIVPPVAAPVAPRVPIIESSCSSQSTPRTSEVRGRQDGENLSINNSCPVIIDRGIPENRKFYCSRIVYKNTYCYNRDVLDCSLTFSVNKNICVLGVQVPSQFPNGVENVVRDRRDRTPYTEILYAHLLDSDNVRLTYTHFTVKAKTYSLVEITFNRPVYIQKDKVYRIEVVFNKTGYYPGGIWTGETDCNRVAFSFGVGNISHTMRDDLIRAIVFTYQ